MKVKRAAPPVVGIDQSYTGFVVVAYRLGHIEVIQMPESKHRGVDRLRDIGLWLLENLPETAAHVCMEGYNHGAKFNREIMGELGAVVKLALRDLYSEPIGYPTLVSPNQLKLFTTGKGNAKKDEMMLAVYKKWGYEAPNNDCADAFGLAKIAAAIVGLEPSQLAYEEAVVAKLEHYTEWAQRPNPKTPRKTRART